MVCGYVWYVGMYGMWVCMVCGYVWYVGMYGMWVCMVCEYVWYVGLWCVLFRVVAKHNHKSHSGTFEALKFQTYNITNVSVITPRMHTLACQSSATGTTPSNPSFAQSELLLIRCAPLARTAVI